MNLLLDPDYLRARRYFLDLYRSEIEDARAWREKGDRRMAAYWLFHAADCRAKLIHGAKIRREALAA